MELKEIYNYDGYYIEDHEKWEYYKLRPKLYKRNKLLAYSFLLIPVCGMIFTCVKFEQMGLSVI